MRYNVAGLLKSANGESRLVQLEESLNLGEPDATLVGPVTGDLRFIRDQEGVLVMGTIAATVRVECARCLEPTEVRIEADVAEQFRPTINIPGVPASLPAGDDADAGPELEIDHHHELDLTEVLRQMVLVALPSHPLCRPDCKGLCPRCGANLNDGPCDCEEEMDPRWAALNALRE